jgi:transposase
MMVTMPKRYPPEVREKAVRLALDRLDDYGSAYAATHAVGPMVDVHPETLRVWIVKALRQDGPPVAAAGGELAATERAELDRLRKENRELKQANDILKLASAFFARELDPRHR